MMAQRNDMAWHGVCVCGVCNISVLLCVLCINMKELEQLWHFMQMNSYGKCSRSCRNYNDYDFRMNICTV